MNVAYLSPGARPGGSLCRLGLVVALAVGLGGCGDAGSATGVVRRWRGPSFATLPLPDVTYAAPVGDAGPRRIVSFIPSVTETIYALGVGDRLVGRSRWCDWPPEVKALPDLGDLKSRSPERVAELRPDLVFTFASDADLIASLRRDFGLTVFSPTTENASAVGAGILEVARALGVEARGEELVTHIDRELAAVRKRWASRPRVRTLLVLDRTQWWVPGGGTFVHRLMDIANAESVSGGLESAWPEVSYETILEWAPEVVLDLSVGADPEAWFERSQAFWSTQGTIPAIRNHRVHLVDAGVLTRPGPRAAAVADLLARIIHEGE